MREQESLYIKMDESIATIEFAHPNANALTMRLLERLEDAFEEISNKESISTIVLRSEGTKTFCAGAALHELITIEDKSQAIDFFGGFAKVIYQMMRSSKVIVGRVQGKAVGGALGLISCCDYVTATESASVKLSELSIGLAPMVIEPVVSRKLGLAGFLEFSLNPTQWHTAYQAKEKGLFSKVYESIKDMDGDLDTFLQRINTYSNKALETLKSITKEDYKLPLSLLMNRAEQTAKLAMSSACRTALEKYRK